MNPYVYMFVRGDLSAAQQIVQTAHAVDEMAKRYKSDQPDNYMVLCPAVNESDLKDISGYLKANGVDHEIFFETDINAYTAICTYPLIGDERLPMKSFKTKR